MVVKGLPTFQILNSLRKPMNLFKPLALDPMEVFKPVVCRKMIELWVKLTVRPDVALKT